MEVVTVRRSYLLSGLAAIAVIAAVAFWAPWTEARGGRTIQVGNLRVTCGPDQQPMVRQMVAQGEQYGVECVPNGLVSMNGANYVPIAAPQPGAAYGQPGVAYAQPAAYTPAVYTRPAPAPVRTVSAPAARTTTQEPARSNRSWQKTALIIGGSTGAGAGVGGIVGGKKGALIGAAIGGGSAAIYEAIKRK